MLTFATGQLIVRSKFEHGCASVQFRGGFVSASGEGYADDPVIVG